jgi:hypothetical protein
MEKASLGGWPWLIWRGFRPRCKCEGRTFGVRPSRTKKLSYFYCTRWTPELTNFTQGLILLILRGLQSISTGALLTRGFRAKKAGRIYRIVGNMRGFEDRRLGGCSCKLLIYLVVILVFWGNG